MKIIRARTSLKQRGLSQKLAKRLRKAPPIVTERLEAYVPRAVLASLKGRSGGRDADALGRGDRGVLLRLHGSGTRWRYVGPGVE